MWNALIEAGLPDQAHILEPGSGTGAFMAAAPETCHITGIERDPTSALIGAALNPHHTTRNEDYTTTDLPDASFHATIGNVPFQQGLRPRDAAHNPDPRASGVEPTVRFPGRFTGDSALR